jgi:hypothetical protein
VRPKPTWSVTRLSPAAPTPCSATTRPPDPQVSRGLPRAVNNLTVQALVAAFATNETVVDESCARAAVTEVTTD